MREREREMVYLLCFFNDFKEERIYANDYYLHEPGDVYLMLIPSPCNCMFVFVKYIHRVSC